MTRIMDDDGKVEFQFSLLEHRGEVSTVANWCTEQFGCRFQTHPRRWTTWGQTIFIYAEDDAFHFRMRWC